MNIRELKDALEDLPDQLEVVVPGRTWSGMYTALTSFRVIQLSQNNLFDEDLHLVGTTAVILGEHDSSGT